MKKQIIEAMMSTAVPGLPSPADEKRDTALKSIYTTGYIKLPKDSNISLSASFL